MTAEPARMAKDEPPSGTSEVCPARATRGTGPGFGAERPLSPRTRLALAFEALFPVAAQQAYIWTVPHDRPRWLDGAFAAVVAAIVAFYVVRRGLYGRRVFGLGGAGEHGRAAGPLAIFTALVVGGLLLWGYTHGGLRREWDVLYSILLYPVWGFVQQAVTLGVVYPRLKLLAGEFPGVLFAAVLFGAAHAPNPLLMLGGAGMVLFFGLVWRRAPSLPLTAVSHGVIGAVCDKALHVSMRVGAHYFG